VKVENKQNDAADRCELAKWDNREKIRRRAAAKVKRIEV
jgi:hypothetical protein